MKPVHHNQFWSSLPKIESSQKKGKNDTSELTPKQATNPTRYIPRYPSNISNLSPIDRMRTREQRTFERGKTSVENQLQIAKLSLSKDYRWKVLSFSLELLSSWCIARDQILEDTA